MIIAIDDSGDPGFKLGEGSSEYFAIAAVYFERDEVAEEMVVAINDLKRQLRWKMTREFKFRKTRRDTRQKFFRVIASRRFMVSLIVVDKGAIERVLPRMLYNQTILATLRKIPGLQKALLLIDGEGEGNYRKTVKAYFRQNLPPGAIKRLKYVDSRSESLIQLADMIAGAAIEHAESVGDRGDALGIIRQHIV